RPRPRADDEPRRAPLPLRRAGDRSRRGPRHLTAPPPRTAAAAEEPGWTALAVGRFRSDAAHAGGTDDRSAAPAGPRGAPGTAHAPRRRPGAGEAPARRRRPPLGDPEHVRPPRAAHRRAHGRALRRLAPPAAAEGRGGRA